MAMIDLTWVERIAATGRPLFTVERCPPSRAAFRKSGFCPQKENGVC